MKNSIKDSNDKLVKDLSDKAKHAIKVGDEYVHENPYQSVLVTGGVGLVIGYLLCRK